MQKSQTAYPTIQICSFLSIPRTTKQRIVKTNYSLPIPTIQFFLFQNQTINSRVCPAILYSHFTWQKLRMYDLTYRYYTSKSAQRLLHNWWFWQNSYKTGTISIFTCIGENDLTEHQNEVLRYMSWKTQDNEMIHANIQQLRSIFCFQGNRLFGSVLPWPETVLHSLINLVSATWPKKLQSLQYTSNMLCDYHVTHMIANIVWYSCYNGYGWE